MTFTDQEYEQMAIQAIKEYKNKDYTDDEIRQQYSLPLKLVIENVKQSLTVDKNVKQSVQGARSVTYKDGSYNVIDDVIKSMIGLPYARMY
ncbi:hypothetical protein [uncultured Clostridium sp.]|uniref:hypothetical protein n=1 Tax=uncultured Clostridium sp. TaxID=59620 RepID=UPI0028E98BC3|nr:hypothetical protein [uncultured Clostridium sp.]